MEGFLRDEAECKHNEGFILLSWSGGERYAWFCRCECGYHMFFDPEKYPDGISYVEKKEVSKIITFNVSKY